MSAVYGTYQLSQDVDGANWLKLKLNADWNVEWESSNKFKDYYGGLAWSVIDSNDASITSPNTFTTANDVEFALLGGKRNSSDKASSTDPALDFDPLIQTTVLWESA